MSKFIIFGTGTFAELAHFYLTNDSPHTIAAFTCDSAHINGAHFLGVPIIPFEDIETKLPPSDYKMLIAIGYTKVNKVRKEKYYAAKNKGYEFISYVCSKSVTWPDLTVGENCFIFENQTIQPFVTIGNNVVLWSGNHIGHHSNIGDHCFLTSHVVISGFVKIEPSCFLGVNASIRDHITIAEGSVVGMGAVITKDTMKGGVYIGNPARLHMPDSTFLQKN